MQPGKVALRLRRCAARTGRHKVGPYQNNDGEAADAPVRPRAEKTADVAADAWFTLDKRAQNQIRRG